MRKVIVLLVAVAMLLVAPAGSAVAQDFHLSVVVHTEAWAVGGAEDGSVIYYEGYYALTSPEGQLLEEGSVESVAYPAQGGQNVTGHVLYTGVEGDYVLTKVAAHLVDFENGYAVYRAAETILETSPDPFAGRGSGYVYVYGEGAHIVSTMYFNLRPA